MRTSHSTFLIPSDKSVTIYNQGKDAVLNTYRYSCRGYRTASNFLRETIPLDLDEFLKAMLADTCDDSDRFLVMFWFNFHDGFTYTVFPGIKSLYPSNLSPSVKKFVINMRRIVANFRNFINQTFVITDSSCWNEPAVFEKVYNSLQIVQIFWYNKLRPLAKKLLTPQEFTNEERLIGKRFNFLNTFITRNPKDQLFREYKIFFKKFSDGKKSLFHFENFYFLAQYFRFKLQSITSITDLEEDLNWLASQPSLLLKYLFCCLNMLYVPKYLITLPECLIDENPITTGYIVLYKESFFIFGKRGSISDKVHQGVVEIARKILQKIQQKTSFK
jgi:hypothetical protein